MKLEIIALLICSIMGRRRRRNTNDKNASEDPKPQESGD
jgi:hypothetical protein